MRTMTLSFSVRPVDSDAAMAQACAVRAQGYGRQLPALASRFAQPDALDESGTCCTFLATDKTSGVAMGTVRVQVGCAGRPLMVESALELPAWLQQRPRAEFTRLAVVPGADPLVRMVLWKLGWCYCMANQVQCVVIGARQPTLIRQYQTLGFEMLGAAPVPFAHAGGLLHSVLWLDLREAGRLWYDTRHPLFEFMSSTHHPDLEVCGPRWRPGAAPRAQRSECDEPVGVASSSLASSQRTIIA